jgi:tRNA-specific 2-thiouridylase
LRQVWFPLGTWNKDDVRALAERWGLPNYDAPDSQELCFVPGGDHGTVVERELRKQGLSTDALQPGPVLDDTGAVIGEHQGIHRVTVGQRRGFQTRGTEKKYVLRIIPEQRAVVVGDAEDARTETIEVGEVQRLSLPEGIDRVRAHVQVSHKSPPAPGEVSFHNDRFVVRFDEPIASAAPGQAAVVYDDEDRVLAGGWITKVG